MLAPVSSPAAVRSSHAGAGSGGARHVRRPRPGSTAAAVYDWVFGLPEGSAFRLSDVPAPPRAAARVLHDIVRDHREIERIFNGFYWRGSPPDSDNPVGLHHGRLAIAYAGPGAGDAGITAVHRLGWTTQIPVGYDICVAGRAPRASSEFVRFSSRSNRMRLDLTWAEVSLLEALLHFHLAEAMTFDEESGMSYRETAWADAVEEFCSEWSTFRLGPGASINTGAVLEAAAGEAVKPDGFLDRLSYLADQVPDTITWDRWAKNSRACRGFAVPAIP